MQSGIDVNHPKLELLFFVAQNVDDGIRRIVRDFVLGLDTLTRWLNGPPRFVDIREDPQDVSGGDLPVETVGGLLEIYSATPPWILPREIDLYHLGEVKCLVNAVCELSRKHELAFEFELDGGFVGAIEDGKPDRSLVEGLIGEWERHLGER